MALRPFFPYYGSKWNIARHYTKPSRDLVIEPFAGSAGYSTLYSCPRVLLFDKDQVICGVWDFLMRASAAEILALPEMPNVSDHVDNYDIPAEAKHLIGFWLNRGSAVPKKSRTAYSARTDRAQLNWGPKAKERIASQISMLSGWRIKCGAYADAPDERATWFIDPPYGDKGAYYRCRFDADEFPALSKWCRERRGDLIVCENPSATWLPFSSLGNFKSSKGRAEEGVFYQTCNI